MRYSFFTIFSFIALMTGLSVFSVYSLKQHIETGAPPYDIAEEDIPDHLDPLAWLAEWTRPDVAPTVGIQVGHWKNDELPEELESLRGNTGASGGGKSEWEVNYGIAMEMKKILEEQGVVVDILPATVPPRYWADVFIAIHADGSLDPSVSGYKFAGPWRDMTGKSNDLVSLLSAAYEEQTDLEFDPNISRNMRGYYAFSWWRREHAVHPMTTAVIAETGFLTNYADQQMLIYSPEIPAAAMSDAILDHLATIGVR